MRSKRNDMNNDTQLQALRNLFLAGSAISDGARKTLGLIISDLDRDWSIIDIADHLDSSRVSAWRWLVEAHDKGLVDIRPKIGTELRISARNVKVSKLEEMAANKPAAAT